jgi:tetratricopeptide (TPR) repeat protein
VAGVEADVENAERDIPLWQRWNDYGIGLLLKGKAELRQAEAAFMEVEKLGRWDGPLNLTRVYNTEGRVDEAVAALDRADQYNTQEGFPRATWSWLSGEINRQQGRLDEAITNLQSVLRDRTEVMRARNFDFSLDYEVINLLGQTLFDLGRLRARQGRADEAGIAFDAAVANFKKTLEIDPENVTAHHNLQLLYSEMGETELSRKHETFHLRYKEDDNAQGRAVRLAREKYPAANRAAEAVVTYPLQRPGAPGLAAVTSTADTRQPTAATGGTP